MYEEGFGNLYHPSCNGLTCRDIPRDLEYNNRKLVHHNNQGKHIRRKDGRLTLFKDVGLDGKQLKRRRIGSPISKKIRTRKILNNPDVVHDECLPDYPGWFGLTENLTKRLGISKFDNQLEELKILWKEWTREAARSYLRQEEIKQPYTGQVPWKDNIVRNTQKISDQLRLNTKIISMFFDQFRDRCLVDCSFLLSENGRSVTELEKQLQDFVLNTKRILVFEWPMAVAHLMLDEGASWIPLLVNATSHTVFNVVAATMARLLYDLILENISRVRHFFDYDDTAKLIIILKEGEQEFDYWQKINVLLELSKIPRVDHKIYPRVFTEAWIDVRSWFDSHSIIFKPLPQPFGGIILHIFEIEQTISKYEKDVGNVEEWERIAKDILDVRDQILRQRSKTIKQFIIYDSGCIKQRALVRITELEEKVKAILLNHLTHMNNEVRSLFSLCSSKLFRNDVLMQLRNIEEVQNELPNIHAKIKVIRNAYNTYMEYFVMPDYDIRQYYEISRLGFKLEQLVSFVWDHIHHERNWITKQVSEQTSKNYYECEMIEKEWLDCLKKYRSAVRINEVQKVQSKMINLAERSKVLKERDEKLIGQRSLLGLPSSPIDCVRIEKVCNFFERLSTLHYRTLLHHESCLRLRISDVDHSILVAETERLQSEKNEMSDEAELINEHVTTSKEALTRIQAVLNEFERLLPVLGAISCQAMKDRHWQQILQDTETTVKVEGNPLVSELLDMNFIEKSEKFEQVGAQAEKERVLEKSIETMRDQWKLATFVTHQPGELLSTELTVQMQAHLARSQTILSSPFAFSILDQIKHWLDTLLNLNTFVHLYKQCDSRWRKIEGVFSTEDIAYQMPHEFRTFKKISHRWLHINNQITEEQPILKQMDLVRSLNTELTQLEILFGQMESGFHSYLRKKRAVFPRLFAVSDELVLSLICDSREPSNCKQYIPLLFPSLTTFDQNSKMEIVSVSTKFETIGLTKPVNVNLSKRHVEKWMHELDVQIKFTVKTRIRLLIEKMNFKLTPIENLLSEPTQVAVLYLKISLTHQVENAMKQNSMTILASELNIGIRECQHCIIHKLIRRQFIFPIYHILKYATSLINRFISEQVNFIDDFKWSSQMRYYWHMENVFIRVGTTSIRYDYEVHDFGNVPDYQLIDESMKLFIYLNHFGFGGKISNLDVSLARHVATALGRPFIICDTSNENECRMLTDGALLFGGVVFMKCPTATKIGKNVERDVYTAHSLKNLKYHFETEITINSSVLILLTESYSTARSIGLPALNYTKTIDESLSLHSIVHREKMTQKFQIITEFEYYGHYQNMWNNYIFPTLNKIIESHETTNTHLVVEQAIFDNFTVCMKKEHRKLVRKLLHIPAEIDNSEEEYFNRKVSQLCHYLNNHQVVVVCGSSLTGKSRVIKSAAKMRGADLHIEFGRWEDLQVYSEMTKEIRRQNKWIVIDGCMCENTKRWIKRLCDKNTIYPWHEFSIIATSEKVIIETDKVNEELKMLPIMNLEEVEQFGKNLRTNEKLRIDDVFEYYTEAIFIKNEVCRKVETMRKYISNDDEKVFNHVLNSTLVSYIPIQQLIGFIFKDESQVLEFFKTVPKSVEGDKFNDTREQTPSDFYIVNLVNNIFGSGLIPFIFSTSCLEFTNFMERLRSDLDSIGWHSITLSIDDKMTVDEVKAFVSNCSIMFGGLNLADAEDHSEGSNFLFIRGIEHATHEVIDWLRFSFEKDKIMKILIVSTVDDMIFTDRLRRFIFSINWSDVSRNEPITPYPYATISSVLQNMIKDIKIKDIRDAISNQLVDAMSDAQMLNVYEKVSTFKEPGEFRMVRGKGFVELPELRDIYQTIMQELEKREKRAKKDASFVTNFEAKNINFIEKITQTSNGNLLIVGDGRIMNSLTIAAELNKQLVYSNLEIKSVQQWRDSMKKLFRECLLEGKQTLLILKINSRENDITSAILADTYSILCHSMIPVRYLTRLFISEFGEKHTLEGKGIWEMLEKKLDALRIAIVIKSEDFSWFMDSHRPLFSKLILNWWGQQSKREFEMEMRDELARSELFAEPQINEIIYALNQITEMKLISSNSEKIKLLSTIVKLARKKKKEVKRIMLKYEKGMDKMKRAEEQVAGMQGELLRLQPELLRTSIETSMLMSTIEKETIDVENAREVVAANENKSNEAATKAQSLKAESEAELASAIPALDAAVEALETMTQSDVSSLKTMRFPPYAVRLCMEAVCILLGVKPAKVINEIGEVINDYWISGQKLLSDIHFLAKIRAFARDETSRRTMKLIREKYLSKEEFDPEKVKQCSLAAEGLCRWVLAIDMYNQISKIVEPKRERLRKAEILVKQHLKQLEIKRKALLKVTEKLQGLSDQFSQMCQKKQELESQISSCETRMDRAERLVQALGGEKDKWKSKITDIMHEDSLVVPYSVGSTLALHVFGKLPIDEREVSLRKTLRNLFPKVEITIPCDMKSLIRLVDDPICFINDDGRSEILSKEYSKVVRTTSLSEKERIEFLSENTVLLFDCSEDNNIPQAKSIELGRYYEKGTDEMIFKVEDNEFEVNKDFRVFFRTHKSEVDLNETIIINNTYSDVELRFEICEKMGSINWAETLSQYNDMVDLKENDIQLMEKTENEMLDLLGRSKDLDDERAIDLLAEARNLQAAIVARSKDIFEIEQSLRLIENKMESTINWSMKLVKTFYSLHKLDSFYRFSMSSLVDVVKTKLFESLATVDTDEVNRTISQLYWKFIQHLLSWNDKMIMYHLLFSNMNYKVERLEMSQSEKMKSDGFLNFSKFVQKTSCRTPIILKYDKEVYATLLQFGEVYRNITWRVYSYFDVALLKFEKLTDESIWLLLNLNEIEVSTVSTLKNILKKLEDLQTVHPSFKLIIAYSSEIHCSDEIISLSSQRFYFSASYSLPQLIKRLLSMNSIRTIFGKSEASQRVQIIRLLSFHYALKLRQEFDKTFNIPIDDADLLAMLKLYQELSNLSDQPNEQLDIEKVRSNVIEPVYFSKSKNVINQNVIRSMAQWIIEGNLSIPADTFLKKVIREDIDDFEDFIHFLNSHEDIALCGFNARICKEIQNVINRKIIIRMRCLFENDFNIASKKQKENNELRSFLEDVDNGSVKIIDGKEINNLSELISCLKIKFALKNKIAVSETSVSAEFSIKDEHEDNSCLIIRNCVLISAHLAEGEIRESHSRQHQYVTINLKTAKAKSARNPRCIPLICPEYERSVAEISIQSQFPIDHWHLRGVYVTVGKNNK